MDSRFYIIFHRLTSRDQFEFTFFFVNYTKLIVCIKEYVVFINQWNRQKITTEKIRCYIRTYRQLTFIYYCVTCAIQAHLSYTVAFIVKYTTYKYYDWLDIENYDRQ
ncbi:hypothetical protein FGO68_gene4074 [Halteria grandinella]|uniref:Uncharacterized protein n=1 Tax=Halteria grandinella TaxID=5974 RepID=A0A8J8N9I3_HALGN|nr:hypothetical protein FGO68_gene4074 [Halteria grandinella]